jgi:FixJ family two-component response regulator
MSRLEPTRFPGAQSSQYLLQAEPSYPLATQYQSTIVPPSREGLQSPDMGIEKERDIVAIVDDDDSVREALEALMTTAGFPVLAFASAKQFLDSGQPPRTACLISDVRMPGISGLELQSILKQNRQQFPIIFITAHGDEIVRTQALRAGATGFLIKPFDDEAILGSVRAALRN